MAQGLALCVRSSRGNLSCIIIPDYGKFTFPGARDPGRLTHIQFSLSVFCSLSLRPSDP